MNRKTVVAKFVTHASAYIMYLINGFIEYYPLDFLRLMHSTCTQKLACTESRQTLPSLCVILKAIRAGVGWVWLVKNLVWGRD